MRVGHPLIRQIGMRLVLSMLKEIEAETRKSEAAIRRTMLPKLIAEPYEKKVSRSEATVNEFVNVLGLDTVYVSTSGGKDSACVSKICSDLYPGIRHVMFDTGLEYAATLEIARSQGAEIIKPVTGWKSFCEQKGYPVGSKQVSKRIHDARISPIGCAITMFSGPYHLSHKWLHFLDTDIPISEKCCNEFKKKPSKKLKLNPIIGTRIQESSERKNAWKKTGCNSFSLDGKHGTSRPISLWSDQDVGEFIEDRKIKLSEIYTQYEAKRTGCVCCPYGAHLEDRSRFELLKELEPKRYEHFMKTRLREILLLSGVEIKSDQPYMDDLKETTKKVTAWHQTAKSDDNYFSWKCSWAVKQHGLESMIAAVTHINTQSHGKLMYPLESIIEEMRNENTETLSA